MAWLAREGVPVTGRPFRFSAKRKKRKPSSLDLGQIGAKPPVVNAIRDDSVVVFIPGKPRNMKNAVSHWRTRHVWAKDWRGRTKSLLGHMEPKSGWPWPPTQPKRVAFTIYSPSAFDDDNWRAVCSPVRDGLQDTKLIDNDRVRSGHSFHYDQVVTRKAGVQWGIAVEISLRQGGS